MSDAKGKVRRALRKCSMADTSPLDPSTEAELDDPELPPSTAPEHFVIACKGFAEEQAHSIGNLVGAYVRVFGSKFDLSHLDGVTVAFDYNQALLDLDRGYETAFKLTPTEGIAVGVAMTPSVLRDGVLKSHIVLNAGYLLALENTEAPGFQFAIHLIAHECAHVEITHKFDTCFPGRLLRPAFQDLWERARSDVSSAVWDDFAATNLSAPFGEDPTNGYEDTFITALTNARANANRAILAYRTHGGVDQVIADVYGIYGNLLKYAAYHLGNLSGQELDWKDRPKTVAALDGHWFAPHFDRLKAACLAVADSYGTWTSLTEFDPIADLADEVVAHGGLHFVRDGEGKVHVDIPYSRETMPDVQRDRR